VLRPADRVIADWKKLASTFTGHDSSPIDRRHSSSR
jgi:hypothetical protein